MKKRTPFVDYLFIAAGAFIMGFAIKNLYDPAGLVTGGVSGAAIIAKELWGTPLWITNTVLNIPLFLGAARLKGWRFIKRTLSATVLLSVALYVLPDFRLPSHDILLSALFGGILTGAGAGMVFLAQATTGGTDMLASLLQLRLKHYSLPQIMQVLDALIVLVGATIFGIYPALYALIAIFCVSKLSDSLIEGVKFSKQAYIISDRHEEIAQAILHGLDRGVTGLQARGMFSGQDKKMLFCVVSKKEIVRLKELVARIDPSAFVIVSDVREVLGEGFIEY